MDTNQNPAPTNISSPVVVPPPSPSSSPNQQATYIDQDKPSSHSSKIKLLLVVFVVMVLIAGGAYYYLTMSKPAEIASTPPPPQVVTPKPTQPKEVLLTVESPTDGNIVTTDKITVKGKTAPNATVVVFTETRQTSIDADSTGMFETEITLSPGINTLSVTSFDEKSDEKTVTLTITYDK